MKIFSYSTFKSSQVLQMAVLISTAFYIHHYNVKAVGVPLYYHHAKNFYNLLKNEIICI